MVARNHSSPAVAVITRTKNRPLLLERSINSVIAQSFKDYLMVIVNDGGDPAPVNKLVAKYKEQLKDRIKVIHNKNSKGMETAANIGIRQSNSKYLVLLDDDDSWHENFLKITIDYLNKSNEMGVVTASEIVREVIKENKVEIISRDRFAPEIKTFNLFVLSGVNQFPNNTFVYKRDAINTIGYYDEKERVLGDWGFNTRFLRHYDIAFIDDILSYYHQRYDSKGDIGNSINSDMHLNYTTEILNKALREDLKSGNLGMGFISNLSHQNAVNMHLQKDRAERVQVGIEDIQDVVRIINERITTIEVKQAKLEESNSMLEQRIAKFAIKLPGLVVKKALTSVTPKKNKKG